MYFNEKNLARAEEYYRKATSVENIFAQPHFNLGSILESQGDISGAIQEYKKAVEIDPSFYYGYQNLASIYGKQGDLENIWLNIEKLLELRPNDPRVYYNAGLVKWAMGDKIAAQDYADKGMILVGNDRKLRDIITDNLGWEIVGPDTLPGFPNEPRFRYLDLGIVANYLCPAFRLTIPKSCEGPDLPDLVPAGESNLAYRAGLVDIHRHSGYPEFEYLLISPVAAGRRDNCEHDGSKHVW